jgi:DNA-binding NarL/FixJ family response regulator
MNNKVIKEAITMIDSSCEQVRAISHNFVPPSLEKFNLVEAADSYCNEIINGLKKDNPDVLLLDINLPNINGIDLSKQLFKAQPELQIRALTNFENISFVKRMLKNGVHGYLLKTQIK